MSNLLERIKNGQIAPTFQTQGIVCMIVDESGSMEGVKEQTMASLNEYIESLKEDDKTSYTFSLIFFSNGLKTYDTNVPIAKVDYLDSSFYQPNGETALYDAIGYSIDTIGEVNPNIKVLVVIATDGGDNASCVYDLPYVRNMITSKDRLPNWKFVFLGADLRDKSIPSALGINAKNVLLYDKDKTAEIFKVLEDESQTYFSGKLLPAGSGSSTVIAG